MRAILFLVFVVVVLALIGWISFGRDNGRASINLEVQEIKDDTQKAIDSGSALMRKAGDKVENATTGEPVK